MNRDREDYLDSFQSRVKRNPSKLKPHFITHETVWSVWAGVEKRHWSFEIGFFRRPRTQSERRMNLAHEDEYGTRIRGNRKGYNLPSSWDDVGVSIYDCRHSWKTNSKRERQYK